MSYLTLLRAFLHQSYPPASKFAEFDVPDLSGRIIVVTGGNTGIGKEITRAVLEHNAKVYIACRSEEKAQAVIKELKEKTGKTELYFLRLDLSNLHAIKKAVDELKSKESKLDILFNNAGIMAPPVEQITTDGFDMTFGTNVVGPFLFTKLLLPLLRTAAAAAADPECRGARVVHTSSLGHMVAPQECIAWETLKPGAEGGAGDKKRRNLGPDKLYYQSKCERVAGGKGVIIVAKEFARRYGTDGIISTSVHPGTIHSELGRHWPVMQRLTTNLFVKLRPTPMGAITQLYAGTAPEGKNLNGEYLIPWARVGKPREDVLDEKLGEKLWNWLEEQTSMSTPFLPIA
ncbi:hypothetical protein EW145_g6137 [Phellinidium pouzarii]|uniref:NAD(P)-binding protein n=1 Tax=Phellinidium pouzarii TaxID=167371 RepID=A0A4S4KY63_9AGAM|nr:hypothetical protein EW145_g6137 [Phellinidium pouzarii]